MAGLRRADRERVGTPCSEYLWLRLLDQITDDDEREVREREGPQAWLDWQDHHASAVLGYFLEGFEGLSPEVFDQALAAYVADNPGRRPSWWWWSTLTMEMHGLRDARYDARHPHAPLVDLFPRLFDMAERRPLYAEPRKRLGGTGAPDWEDFSYVPQFEYGIPARLVDVDPKNPPRFESQAEYLRRRGLLLPGEERRLRPADFRPEKVEVE